MHGQAGRRSRNKDGKGTSPNSPLPLRIRPSASSYRTTILNGMLWTTFTVYSPANGEDARRAGHDHRIGAGSQDRGSIARIAVVDELVERLRRHRRATTRDPKGDHEERERTEQRLPPAPPSGHTEEQDARQCGSALCHPQAARSLPGNCRSRQLSDLDARWPPAGIVTCGVESTCRSSAPSANWCS